MMIWMVINWLRIPVVIIAFREVLFRRPWWVRKILQDVWGSTQADSGWAHNRLIYHLF